jgi:hypothetical protein
MKHRNKLLKVFSIITFFFALNTAFVIAQEDTTKVRELIKSAQDKTKPYTEVVKLSNSAIELSEKINFQQGKADALNIKVRHFLSLANTPMHWRHSGQSFIYVEKIRIGEIHP